MLNECPNRTLLRMQIFYFFFLYINFFVYICRVKLLKNIIMEQTKNSKSVSVKSDSLNRGCNEKPKRFNLFMCNLDTNHISCVSENITRKEIFYLLVGWLDSERFPVNRYLVSFSKSFFACYNYYFKNFVTRILSDLGYVRLRGFDANGCIPILNLIPRKNDSCRTCFFVKEVSNE